MSRRGARSALAERLRESFVWLSDRVDDWIATGGQALGVRRLVDGAGASWVGAAVVVDALTSNDTRRAVNVRALLHEREL